MNQDPTPTPLADRAQADFLSLAETLSSLIALIRGDRLIYVNPAGCKLLGYPKEWLVGRNFWEVVHPGDRERAQARGRARQAGIPQPKRLLERLVRADGRTVWMDYAVDLIHLQGLPTTLVTGHDVTGRRRVQRKLRQSEARLAEAQRIAHIGSWQVSLPEQRLSWSEEMCRIYGVAPSDFGGTLEGYMELVHPDDRAEARARIDAALRSGSPFAFEHRVVHPDGSVRAVSGRGEVFLDAAGQPVRVAGTAQDITERLAIARALSESEQRFRQLVTQAPVMLMSFDPGGRVREVSHYWLQTMGYTREEVVGRDGYELLTPESEERLRAAVEEVQRSCKSVLKNLPLRLVRKDGSTLDVLSTSVAEVSDAGELKGAITVQVDLTDLQRAEAALLESEERYRALVEHAPEAIMVLDVELGRFVDVNAHAEKLFGYARERLLTMGPLDFCSKTQEDGRPSCEMLEDEHRKVLEGEPVTFEFTHVDASGREIVCQTRLARLPAAGRKLLRATVTDISEMKELQEKVRQSEKLAAVGMLAAGVAHEIGNPLMALSMAAQSLERRTCDTYTQGKLSLIREHIDRISRIVRQMGDLARPQSGMRTRCDVNGLVRRAVEMVRFDKRARSAQVRYELADPAPEVSAVEDQLTQVCINLALNAFDAMAGLPEGAPRCLTVRSQVVDGRLRVSFRDTGPGVEREERERIFQPFFTTKDVGLGTGLGLSVSYRILQEHHGDLRCEDDGQPGACFTLELPLDAPV